MPEEKKELQQQQQQQEGPNGLFPFKVKKFLSGVASAGQAALREAQALQQLDPACEKQRRVPPISVSHGSKSKEPSLKHTIGRSDSKKQQKNLLTTPPTPPPAPRRSVAISPEIAVDMTKGVIEQPTLHFDTDWEILSKTSNNSGVVVSGPRAGSVRSITSLDQDSSPQTTLSVPFKIQRTNSSSTIDSQDNALGPSGKGVLGVDYVEHVVLPTDTLQGICIAYKVSASQLRRANHFSGTLHSAPKKLVIPLSKQALRTGFIRVQDTDTKEYKLHYFQAEFPDINAAEAKVYLELADWELKDALQAAKEDREWERGCNGEYEDDQNKTLKSGQIGIKVGFNGKIPTFNLTGTGHAGTSTLVIKKSKKRGDNIGESFLSKEKVVVHSRPPAIATKSVLAEDLYTAAPQHGSYGFELKAIPSRN